MEGTNHKRQKLNMKRILTILLASSVITFSSCGFKEKIAEATKQANNQFGDQHFKTAISLIELHKVRFGEYPESLDSLKYIGDWDKIIFSSVEYQKLDTGYVLNVTHGIIGDSVHLKYDSSFWKGLGLKRSNVKN